MCLHLKTNFFWFQTNETILVVTAEYRRKENRSRHDHHKFAATVYLGDDGVVGEGDALLLNLAEAALVEELRDGLQVGGAPGEVGGGLDEHLHGGLVHADKGASVDVAEAEELEDLLHLGGNTVGTLDADDEDDLGLIGDVELGRVLRDALEADNGLLLLAVLLDVLLSTLEDLLADGLALLLVAKVGKETKA